VSLCTNQQLTVLAAVSGCLAVMLTPGKVGQVVRKRYIAETQEVVDEVIAGWETTGDDLENFNKNIQPAILAWHEFLEPGSDKVDARQPHLHGLQGYPRSIGPVF